MPPVMLPQPAAPSHTFSNIFSMYFGSFQWFSSQDEEVFGFREENGTDEQPFSDILELSSKVAVLSPLLSPVSLNKVSLQLIPRPEEGTYHLQFIFDSTVSVIIRVYFFLQNTDTGKLPMDVPGHHFEAGFEQVFITNEENYLNTNVLTEDEIREYIDTGKFPVIISLEPALIGEDPEKEKKNTFPPHLRNLIKMY
jgi:hypothetical protein